MLMSATMNADVERLQKLVLHNPLTLNLLASEQSGKAGPGSGSTAGVEHFSIATDRCPFCLPICRTSVFKRWSTSSSSNSHGLQFCILDCIRSPPATLLPEKDKCWACRRSKLLQTLVLLRLGLVRKKVLMFVNSINEGVRLRLFLEAFGIRAAALNAELPLNSRHHILQVCPCSSAPAFSHCMYQ